MSFLSSLLWEWTRYDFMWMALGAVALIAPLYGLLGTMVVDGRMAFFADSLGHSAMTGIAIGVLLGMQTPLWAMLVFGVIYATLLSWVKSRGSTSTDTTISVFSATGMALGVVLLSRNGGFAKYAGFLVGDLLAIERSDLLAAGIVLVITVVYWLLLYNKLLLTSVSATLARSRGIHTRFVETSFACLLAIVVMLSIRWVGVLIISAMLVLPSAAARNLAKNVWQYHLLAVLLALLCGSFGLILSFAWGTASGATIVLVLACCYGVTLALHASRRHA